MPAVSSLARPQLDALLRGSGLYLRTGPFTTCIKSTIPHIIDGIARMYADHRFEPQADYADFYVTLSASAGWRRWFRRQVNFHFDGDHPFLPLPLDQAFPMLEWVLNWCITGRAHSYLILHAAVVEKHGRALIMPAPPGSGKSTLCAALVNSGWRLLSDELTLVGLDDGLLTPVPRPISLKNASIGVIRAFVADAIMSRAVAGTIKGTIAHLLPPAASIARAGERALPGWVIFPRYQAGSALVMTPLPKARAFMQVAENSFNYSVVGAAGFDALGGLIERSDCYQLTYSSLAEAIERFDALARGAP